VVLRARFHPKTVTAEKKTVVGYKGQDPTDSRSYLEMPAPNTAFPREPCV
jgi:hypothetical protein